MGLLGKLLLIKLSASDRRLVVRRFARRSGCALPLWGFPCAANLCKVLQLLTKSDDHVSHK